MPREYGLVGRCPQRGKVFGLQIGEAPILTKTPDELILNASVIPERRLNQFAILHLDGPVGEKAIAEFLAGELAIKGSGRVASCIHVKGLPPCSTFWEDLHLLLHPPSHRLKSWTLLLMHSHQLCRGVWCQGEVWVGLRRSIGFAGTPVA